MRRICMFLVNGVGFLLRKKKVTNERRGLELGCSSWCFIFLLLIAVHMICYSILIELGIKSVRKIELSPLHNCWGCPKVQSELEVGVEAQYNFFFKCADIFSASFAI